MHGVHPDGQDVKKAQGGLLNLLKFSSVAANHEFYRKCPLISHLHDILSAKISVSLDLNHHIKLMCLLNNKHSELRGKTD